jgi:hypothetical protein
LRDPAAHRVQLIVYEAALAALAVTVGFVLAAVPNVELFTLVVFLAGVLLGRASGARVGVLAALVYGLLSPYGLPDPILLTALLLSRLCIGVLGGSLRVWLLAGPRAKRVALFAVAGLLSSLIFQVLTNLAIGLTVGQWRVVLAGAVPYALVNMASNVASFSLLGVSTVDVVRRLPIPILLEEDG